MNVAYLFLCQIPYKIYKDVQNAENVQIAILLTSTFKGENICRPTIIYFLQGEINGKRNFVCHIADGVEQK